MSLMVAGIPDTVRDLFPDSMGALISAVWMILIWVLRHLALLGSDTESASPYRGLLCSLAAFCGSVALGGGVLALLALIYIPAYGILLAMMGVPIALIAGLFAYLFYRGARGDTKQTETSERWRTVGSTITKGMSH